MIISKKINPFESSVNDLFMRLNDLNGLLYHIQSQLNGYRKLIKEILEKNSFNISDLVIGSSLVIRDLTEFPEDKWARYYSSGIFSSQGEECFQRINELLNRESAWTVSQGFEAFETFLKDIYANYLLLKQTEVDEKILKKLDTKLRNLLLKPTRIEYWKEFVRMSNINNAELLKIMRGLSPDLKKTEEYNTRGINLVEWYITVEAVRHATTHSNMLIQKNKMSSWSLNLKKMLHDYFPGNDTKSGGYVLEIDVKRAELNLVLFAEYAFVIFKSMSILNNYNYDVLKKEN
jgi:hypothetical protein